MSGKTGKHFLFEVELNWLCGTKGNLMGKGATGTLHIAASPMFGGEGKPWSPEHFFLSAISGSYMTSFLEFARKSELLIKGLECVVIGHVESEEDNLRFTEIHLYPKIFLYQEEDKPAAQEAIGKTQSACLIINSVNAQIIHHPELLTDPVSLKTAAPRHSL